jgi:hypothetical protein
MEDSITEEEVREVLEELVTNCNRLYDVAERLYFAGTWRREGSIPSDDAGYWEELRNVLGLPEGLATKEGVNG